MARSFRMTVTGGAELAENLRELPRRLQRGAIRRALIKAGQPIAEAARALVPVRTGRLQRSIQVSATLSRRQRRGRAGGAGSGITEVFIGAGPSRSAHLVEFGTGPRHHRSGKYVGQVAARPFMRPAWDAGKDRALADFARLLGDEIKATAERLARRLARASGG